MLKFCRPLVFFATGVMSAGVLFGQVEATAAAVSSGPLPFIGITPCRLIDTRNAAAPPGYGPPSLSPGVPAARTFVVSQQCGIPFTAEALSLNVTVTNTQGAGYIVLYPQGSSLPPVSTLTYSTGQTVANAAIVPVSAGGLTVVAGVSGTDLIIDVNGYYAGSAYHSSTTFLGSDAGTLAATGLFNTGLGSAALHSIADGESNTGVGMGALFSVVTGYRNTAVGDKALAYGDGHDNTAVGAGALSGNLGPTWGNIAIGSGAGTNLESGDRNIYIGNAGALTEFMTIRIGSSQTRAFFSGIRGVTTGSPDAVPVVIDSAGQLGTLSSSRRTKEDIESMADASNALLRLRPVRFRYKGQSGDKTHFGLIAEEVDEVLPELVVHDASGSAETVLYHEMPAMLLNELQKQQRHLEQQDMQISDQRTEIDDLRRRLSELETQWTGLTRAER